MEKSLDRKSMKIHCSSKTDSVGEPPPIATAAQTGQPDVVLRKVTPVKELLWYNYFFSL